jgi:rhodanese-related sulfurtransferase
MEDGVLHATQKTTKFSASRHEFVFASIVQNECVTMGPDEETARQGGNSDKSKNKIHGGMRVILQTFDDRGRIMPLRPREPFMQPEASNAYAGTIDPAEVWSLCAGSEPVALVDVRTKAEWTYVGVPELSRVGRVPLFVEWQTYPDMAVDPSFVPRLARALEEAGVPRDAPVCFLCRSGVRSLAAAVAMTAAGWQRCLNIKGGFEGPIDGGGHRGRVEGWKASGLPWTQT